jgi:hypothetical protein
MKRTILLPRLIGNLINQRNYSPPSERITIEGFYIFYFIIFYAVIPTAQRIILRSP